MSKQNTPLPEYVASQAMQLIARLRKLNIQESNDLQFLHTNHPNVRGDAESRQIMLAITSALMRGNQDTLSPRIIFERLLYAVIAPAAIIPEDGNDVRHDV